MDCETKLTDLFRKKIEFENIQWTQKHDILLMKKVSKWPILVDPSTSNNSLMRKAAWEQVRNVVALEREQWPSSKSISFSQTQI